MKPVIKRTLNASPQFHVLGGRFAFGPSSIPFFTTHMTVAQVFNCLKTPNELAGWTDDETEIEALFQRQLDYKRVNDQILPYLTSDGFRPRFFNALTVAVVPYMHSRICSFADTGFHAPDLESTSTTEVVCTGPISLGLYLPYSPENPDCLTLGEIRWNMDEVACVAVDGQHRLHALKRLHSLDPQRGALSRVCVMLLIPSPDLGFHQAGEDSSYLLRILRSVFIDLNKHAKPVKRSRLILLDDLDPISLGVRRLVGERLESVTGTNVVSKDNRIPLALVDWHSDEAKFDSGPYLSSVLMLDRALQTLLECGPIGDWSSKRAVQTQFQAFQRFGYTPTQTCDSAMAAFLDAEEAWQKAFSYPPEDLLRIQDVIGDSLAPVVGRVLTELEPYKRLISLRGQHEMLSSGFSSWYQAWSNRNLGPEANTDLLTVRERILQGDNPPNLASWEQCLNNEIDPLKTDNLFYKVVFQDAVFRALQQLWRYDVPALRDFAFPTIQTQQHRDHWTSELIKTLNTISCACDGFFSIRYEFQPEKGKPLIFWLGSVLNITKDTVDFSNSAMIRASDWIVLMVLLRASATEWRESGRGAPASSLQQFRDQLTADDPNIGSRLESLENRITVGNAANRGSMYRVAQAQLEFEGEEEELERKISRAAKDRFRKCAAHVWEFVR